MPALIPDVDIDALDTAELLALRVDLRHRTSLLMAEKARLNGLIRAAQDGDPLPGAPDERTLRHQRRTVNIEITERAALLDRVKLRLFVLQAPPRPKVPPDPSRQTTAEERAARLAVLDAAGPDALLVRLSGVMRSVLDAAGIDMLSQDDRRTLGDVSFYLRQKLGSRESRDRVAAGAR